MRILGNILWFIVTGLITGLLWVVFGVIWCITLVGIPFGIQGFKMAKLAFFPFGKKIELNFDKHPVMNVIWMIFSGLSLCVAYALFGVIWCITIIGIPFGKQCFKMAKQSLMPFGAGVFK